MNKLQEQIENVLDDLYIIASDGITIPEAAQSCTTITIEFAKGFAEWLRINTAPIANGEYMHFSYGSYKRNIDQLIEIYIKTL